LQLSAVPLNADPVSKETTITRDNFISFWWFYDSLLYTLGESEPRHASFKIHGNVIRCELRGTSRSELTAYLSNNQVDALINQLNKRQPNEEGKKHEDYPKVLFTLIFSDKDNKDRSVDFVFFEDTSKSNVALENYLHDLAQMKFPELFYVPPAAPFSSNANASNH